MRYPTRELKNILFFDIETATIAREYGDMPKSLREHWTRKSNYLASFQEYPLSEEEVSSLYDEKAAIFAEYARVICISAGFLSQNEEGLSMRIKTLHEDEEHDLLKSFAELLHNHFYDKYNHYLCGHNIRSFDVPFLARRFLIHRMGLPNLLDVAGTRPWQTPHLLDTMELWKFGDFKHFVPLDLLCHVLGVESPKSNMSGQYVNTAYWEGRLSDIVSYCEQDLIATSRVYLRCTGAGELDDDQIISLTATG
jgi:predicted PolB exonuclease-like 3'-5' exonuclease